jgi:hypothetical protein
MHLLQAGVNLIYIRDLLGHADASTTEIYARADTDAKRKAIESALPVAHPRAPARLDGRPGPPRMARSRLPITPRDYVAGTGPCDTPASGNIPAGHITQPST